MVLGNVTGVALHNAGHKLTLSVATREFNFDFAAEQSITIQCMERFFYKTKNGKLRARREEMSSLTGIATLFVFDEPVSFGVPGVIIQWKGDIDDTSVSAEDFLQIIVAKKRQVHMHGRDAETDESIRVQMEGNHMCAGGPRVATTRDSKAIRVPQSSRVRPSEEKMHTSTACVCFCLESCCSCLVYHHHFEMKCISSVVSIGDLSALHCTASRKLLFFFSVEMAWQWTSACGTVSSLIRCLRVIERTEESGRDVPVGVCLGGTLILFDHV